MKNLIALSLLCTVFMGLTARSQDTAFTRTLYGTVCTAQGGNGICGAIVIVDGVDTTMTDRFGQYLTRPFRVGRTEVIVLKEGFYPHREALVIWPGILHDGWLNVDLFRLSDTVMTPPSLAPKDPRECGSVRGVVVYRDSKEKLADVMLWIDGTKTVTDRDGRFYVPLVSAGRQVITLRAPFCPVIRDSCIVARDSTTEVVIRGKFIPSLMR